MGEPAWREAQAAAMASEARVSVAAWEAPALWVVAGVWGEGVAEVGQVAEVGGGAAGGREAAAAWGPVAVVRRVGWEEAAEAGSQVEEVAAEAGTTGPARRAPWGVHRRRADIRTCRCSWCAGCVSRTESPERMVTPDGRGKALGKAHEMVHTLGSGSAQEMREMLCSRGQERLGRCHGFHPRGICCCLGFQ